MMTKCVFSPSPLSLSASQSPGGANQPYTCLLPKKKASLEARQAGTLQTRPHNSSRPAILEESPPFWPGLAQSTATPRPGRTDLSYLADLVARETSESHYFLQPPPFEGGVHLSFHPRQRTRKGTWCTKSYQETCTNSDSVSRSTLATKDGEQQQQWQPVLFESQ
jgi:hypothetical protein